MTMIGHLTDLSVASLTVFLAEGNASPYDGPGRTLQLWRNVVSWVNDMRLRWKLLGSFGALLVLMFAVGGVGLWSVSLLKTDIHEIADREMPAAIDVMDARDAVRTIQRDVSQMLLVDGTESVQAAQKSIAASQQRVADDLTHLEKLLYLPAGQAKLAHLKTAYADWSSHVRKTVDLASSGDRDGAKAVMLHPETVKSVAVIDAAMDDLIAFKKARVDAVVHEADEGARFATTAILATVALALVIGLTIALLLARQIMTWVNAIQRTSVSLADNCATWLADALRAVADGDLSVKVTPVTPPIERHSKDELGQLAATTNALRNKIVACMTAYEEGRSGLQQIVTEVRTAAGTVAHTSQQLGAASGQTSAAVQQVTQAIQNVASGAQETSRSAQTSSDAVEQLAQVIDSVARGAQEQARQIQIASETTAQMAVRIDRVAGNAQAVAQVSLRTRESAESGARAVRETVDGMQEIRSVVSEAAGKVEELGRLGEKIGAVIETIDDIAEQTNLLALNAAIEAARAGEHGRGFAVVADEVRKLAERSQRETKAIADLIREVQSGTQDAVAAMEVGSVKVEQGTVRADRAGGSLAEILTAIEATVERVSGIATSAQEMATGAQSVVDTMSSISAVVEESSAATEEMAAQAGQVTGAIQSIAAVSEENSAATEEVSASAEEMSAQVEEISAQAEELAATADQLKELVSRFQLEDAPSEPIARRRADDWSGSRRPAGALRAV